MAGPAPPEDPAPGEERLDPVRTRAVLLILSAAALMVTYVETMIIPGLVRFQTFFDNAPYSSVTWILSAYLLVGVAFTPIAGKLGDIYGKKRVLVGILAVYLVAVTLAGFSPNIGSAAGLSRAQDLYVLIGVRGLQGVGMAMFPLAFALIGEEFPKRQVAQAQGFVSAMFSAGASIGLFGGAWITQTFGWQLTYHTVIPLAAIVLVLTIVYLQESRIRLLEPIDGVGSLLLGATLALFLLALTEGPTWGWGNLDGTRIGGIAVGVPTLFAFAALGFVLFVVWERRASLPVLDFGKLLQRNILLSNLVGLLAGIAMFLMFVGVVARAEAPPPVGLGKSPLDFGYYSLPTTGTNMIAAPLIGRWVGRRGPKGPMLFGSLLVVVGGLLLAVANTQVIDLILFPIPVMTGIIAIFIAMINLVVVSSKPAETGVQTGMNLTFRNLGTSIGPVAGATVLASVLTTYVHPIPLPGGGIATISFQAPGDPAFQLIFLLIAGLGVASGLLTLPIRNVLVTARAVPPAPDDPARAPRVDA